MSRSRASRTSPAPRKRAGRARATYHHGDLRTVLLEQVRLIIREQGVGVVSIREVARRARVSHGAPAHHFGNKAGLLTAFAAQGYDRLAACIRARILETGAATPAELVESTGQGYVRFALTNPEHFSIMFPGDLLNRDDPDYIRSTDSVYGPFIQTIGRAAAEGVLSADPALIASSAWSLAHGLASLWLSGRIQARTGATDPDALTTAATHLFVTSVMTKREPQEEKLPQRVRRVSAAR